MVLSEKTMPQPKVSLGPLRSTTVTSQWGQLFLRRIDRYNPAGPPPRQTIFISIQHSAFSTQPDRGAENLVHKATNCSRQGLEKHSSLNSLDFKHFSTRQLSFSIQPLTCRIFPRFMK